MDREGRVSISRDIDRVRDRGRLKLTGHSSSRSLAGLVRRQAAGLTVEPGLIEFRIRAPRRFVIPASNLAASHAILFRLPRSSSASGCPVTQRSHRWTPEILSTKGSREDTYLEQKEKEFGQFYWTGILLFIIRRTTCQL